MTANPGQDATVPGITLSELQAKLERGDAFVLAEALPEVTYREFHIAGAVNLPVGSVREAAAEVIPDRSTEVVVYCTDPTCPVSERVGKILLQMGYENVKHYAGGKMEWREAGLPLEGEAV